MPSSGIARRSIDRLAPGPAVHKLFTFDHLTNHLIYGIIVIEREGTIMLQKNIDKQKRKERKTWVGLYTRTTPTKRGKLEKISKKYRKSLDKCD